MAELQEEIIRYRKSGAGYKQIAKFCNTNRDYVRQVLKKFEIKDVWQPQKRICKQCGKEFTENSTGQQYCSKECCALYYKRKALEKLEAIPPRLKPCKTCGKLFAARNNKEYCSVECKEAARKESYHRYEEQRRLTKKPLPQKTFFCPGCGKMVITTQKNKKYCSARCGKKYRGKGRIYILREEERVKTAVENDKTVNLRVLIKRDKNTCTICGCQCDLYDYTVTASGAIICGDKYPSIDHIYPLSKGGSNTWDNVQLACRKCNMTKGATVDGEEE